MNSELISLIDYLYREVIAHEVEDMLPNHHQAGDKLCDECYTLQRISQRIRGAR